MATFTLRRLDDEVAEQFKQMAKDHGRSAEAELRSVVEEATKQYIEQKAEKTKTNRDFIEQLHSILRANGITEDDEPFQTPLRDMPERPSPFEQFDWEDKEG